MQSKPSASGIMADISSQYARLSNSNRSNENNKCISNTNDFPLSNSACIGGFDGMTGMEMVLNNLEKNNTSEKQKKQINQLRQVVKKHNGGMKQAASAILAQQKMMDATGSMGATKQDAIPVDDPAVDEVVSFSRDLMTSIKKQKIKEQKIKQQQSLALQSNKRINMSGSGYNQVSNRPNRPNPYSMPRLERQGSNNNNNNNYGPIHSMYDDRFDDPRASHHHTHISQSRFGPYYNEFENKQYSRHPPPQSRDPHRSYNAGMSHHRPEQQRPGGHMQHRQWGGHQRSYGNQKW